MCLRGRCSWGRGKGKGKGRGRGGGKGEVRAASCADNGFRGSSDCGGKPENRRRRFREVKRREKLGYMRGGCVCERICTRDAAM